MIYYHAFREEGGDGKRRGVSAQFDKASEPERRQAARKFTRLPRGWRQSSKERRKRKLK